MLASPPLDVTRLLLAWGEGDADALEMLLPVVYPELLKIAHARMRAEGPGHLTLQTTALVHEAYLRLVDGTRVPYQNRAHVAQGALRPGPTPSGCQRSSWPCSGTRTWDGPSTTW